jgi:hypothetical protein
LDLWTGVLTSRFVHDGEAVTVRTRMHPTLDTIVVDVDCIPRADYRAGQSSPPIIFIRSLALRKMESGRNMREQ